jgi:hypothetical protein
MGKGKNDPFGDMIDSILQGQGASPSGRPSLPGDSSRGKPDSGGSGNPLDDFFGDERRAGATQPKPQAPELPGIGSGSIIDILGSILGGMGGGTSGQAQPPQIQPQTPAQPERPPARPQSNGGSGLPSDLDSVIDDILGGNTGAPQRPQRPSQQQPELPGGIGDILGGILGGRTGSGAGGGVGIDPGMAGNPILAPIVNSISKKLGLPPAIVAIGLSLILNKLLSNATSAGRERSAPHQSPSIPQPSSSGGLDLDDILGQMRAGSFDRSSITQSGVVDAMSGETGLGQDDARALADEIIAALAAEGSARPMPKQSGSGAHGGLKDLLNEW